MKIKASTKTYGLLGNPIEHSISPIIHNMFSEELQEDAIYETFCVEKGQLEQAIKGAYALKIQGLNITVPFKTEVIDKLVFVEEEAKKIGAVNTLVYQEDGYHGLNTDCEGLHQAFISDGIPLEELDILILGAGGAARAVLYMCMKYSKKNIYICNRTKEKAISLAEEMNDYFGRDQVVGLGMDSFEQIPQCKKGYLAIQTTSVGLYPFIKDCIVTDASFFQKVAIGYDIIYTPEETAFMKEVTKAGGIAYNGLKMLLFQAVLAYETWRKKKIPLELSEKVLVKMKDELNAQN